MTFAETTLLGAIAGSTIFLGLPVGRMQRVSPRARVALSMLAAGILVFILVDVCAEGMGIVEAHLESFREDHASFAPVLGLFAVLAGGFLIGVGGIATAQRWLLSRQGTPPLPPVGGAESAAVLDASELTIVRRAEATAERRALGTAMTIAVAIGLHNFAEGLAIGVSAQAGERNGLAIGT